MLIFTSWSGERSSALAKSMVDWLPKVIQSVRVFYSKQIEKGKNGVDEIQKALAKCSAGIIFLTPENLNNAWIHYEAGALSKFRDKSRVWTLLYDLDTTDVSGPLSQFQHTLCEKEDLRSLVKSINGQTQNGIKNESTLMETFDQWWPSLENQISKVSSIAVKRSKDGIEEKLDQLLRKAESDQNANLADIVRSLRSENLRSGTPEDVKKRYR